MNAKIKKEKKIKKYNFKKFKFKKVKKIKKYIILNVNILVCHFSILKMKTNTEIDIQIWIESYSLVNHV